MLIIPAFAKRQNVVNNLKKILKTILILTFTVSFSQTEKDLTEIIELVIAEYQSDTIIVHNRFDNDELIAALKKTKSKKDTKIHEKYGTALTWDIIINEMDADSITVEVEKVKVEFFPTIKVLEKKNNKSIRQYTKTKLKRTKKRPIAYISFPLISTDRKRAIVYGSYNCGALCGSGGIFYLENVNGKWKLVEYERRWVA